MVITKEQLKDIIKECIEEETLEENTRELDESDYQFIKDYMLKCYIEEEYNEYITEDNEVLEEGANLDMRKIFRQYEKEYKDHVKQSKKYLKDKEYDKARKELDKCKPILKKMEKEINNCDPDIGSVILGLLTNIISTMAGAIIGLVIASCIICGIKYKSNLTLKRISLDIKGSFKNSMIFTLIITNIENIDQFCKDIKNKDVSTANAFNLYRSDLIKTIRTMEKNIDNSKKMIDLVEKSDKKKEEKKKDK